MESWCEELLLALFQYLSVRDRGILAQVCCKYRRLLSDATLWRDVAVTFSQGQVLLRVGKSAPSPVKDIGQYAHSYGSMAKSLHLKVSSPVDAFDCKLLKFLVKMKDAELECLSLSLKEVVPHLTDFLKTQTALRHARVTSTFPLTCLQCLTEICQSSACKLQKLCWHYKPLRLTSLRRSGRSQSLQQLARFSREGTALQRALQVFCQTAGNCPKLRLFQTNVFSSVIWRHLVNSTYRTSAHLLTVALTVDESSTLGEPTTATLTAEECQKFRVVLYVDSLLFIDINSLIDLPGQLQICEMYVKANDAGELPIATAILRQMTTKFQRSLTTTKLQTAGFDQSKKCTNSLKNCVQNWSVFLACLSLAPHAYSGSQQTLHHTSSRISQHLDEKLTTEI